MQYIPGSSVTLSASLSYVQRNLPLPDDSEVGARVPKICVDYLSHEWLEEDVWKSWRNMTRHKSEITNGVRLENASWRTWWKQRNNLPTVSPETLNWLKDSDVTWLYGPLHTAAEPVPPPKQSTAEERLNLVNATGKKPILKHRTITELLQGSEHYPVAIGSPSLEAIAMDFGSTPTSREGSPRPILPQSRSDTHITRPRSASGHHGSPARSVSILEGHDHDHDSVPSRTMSPSHSDGLAGSVSNLSINTPAKRHISFNTFVEQCISIDDPNPSGTQSKKSAVYDSEDDLIPDDGEDDDVDSSTSSVLEMRAGAIARRPDERHGGPILRSNSTSQERERMTIAPIPPTLLKTSEELPAPSPQVVYQPPKEFIWDGPIDFANNTSSSSSSGSTSSSDNLVSAMGSITGAPIDMGFVSPQWGRPAPPPGTVGKGSLGPSGPVGLEEDLYETAGYQEPPRPVIGANAMSPPSRGIGIGAGRSKWVPGSAIPDDEDEETSESSESSATSSGASGDEEEAVGVPSTSPPTIVSSSSNSSASRTVVGVPLVRSPPQAPRSAASRSGSVSSSQPGKSILKNSSAGGKGSSVGSAVDDASGKPRHSEPIGIPVSSIAHMPATATISTASPTHLSPQPDNQWIAPATSDRRGRSSTRTSSSASGISDRSRSSSKISGTSSPIGSVSPSGYGSPSGSRANSVMGNKRSSTDVGVARAVSARQASTSPPAVGSPLANSISASSLGTIVANVPMNSTSPPAAGERGPPISRSGIANAAMNAAAAKRPRIGPRTGSSSSINSNGSGSSSGSSGTMHATRTPMDNIAQVLPPAPPAASATPLQVSPSRKSSLPPIVPPGEAPPTVITTPTKSASGVDSTSSSAGQSPSGGTLTMEGRDSKLDEAMRKNQAQTQKQVSPQIQLDDLDGESRDNGTFNEYKSTNPTPSNSPTMGLSKPLSSSAPPPTTPSSPPATSTSLGKKPAPVTVSSPSAKSSISTPVVTPTSAFLPSADDHGIVGKAADSLMSSAKGLLGAIWGSGDGASGSR